MAKKKKSNKSSNANDLMRKLVMEMDACPDAESLNNQVLRPFVAALEVVCGARGYVLNIYGETSNIIFTGDPDDAEEIFRFTDTYLASREDSMS